MLIKFYRNPNFNTLLLLPIIPMSSIWKLSPNCPNNRVEFRWTLTQKKERDHRFSYPPTFWPTGQWPKAPGTTTDVWILMEYLIVNYYNPAHPLCRGGGGGDPICGRYHHCAPPHPKSLSQPSIGWLKIAPCGVSTFRRLHERAAPWFWKKVGAF